MADEHDLPWIIVNAGDRLQIYSTKPNVGVGRRGRTETYTEVLLDLLAPQDAGYVPLLFSSEALKAGGYLEELIRRSAERVTDLGSRLRDRVYNDILPSLATGIAVARGLQNPTIDELRTTHGMALSTLFRMLFISYAEDRDLLPYTESAGYQEISLKKLALEWSIEEPAFEDSSSALWDRLATITRAVHDGSETLQIPAYGGTPFSADSEIAPLGHLLEGVRVADSVFGPALRALILDESADEGLGPIDFRELSVREFGTIYEGLLESELTFAETDLATDRKGFYRPAVDNDDVIVQAGEFYLNNGGKRKSTASFYTKEFAVEHLLERSLEPALDDHLARIDSLETDQEKSEAFFDFMIADISMGSGHFLVAAVDRIERRFSSYLDENPLEGVRTELNRLWNLAAKALGKSVDETGINQPMLLRRQIARRCIYGVDLNPTAVELARVSIWIHTFVPGLPLSFLDWHLRQGNSILGVATQDEAWRLLTRDRQSTLFADMEFDAQNRMQQIMEMMAQISRSSDSTTQEVEEARAAHIEAFTQLQPWDALMDVITASRLNSEIGDKLQLILDIWGAEPRRILSTPQYAQTKVVLQGLSVFHHQSMFPEVFWRQNPGFDVIVGNPPWAKPILFEDDFWSRYIPNLQGNNQSERDRLVNELKSQRADLVNLLQDEKNSLAAVRLAINKSDYPGMGTGDPDLYKAFCWRFIHLLRNSGRLGVVLPRSAFQNQGTQSFREALIDHTAINEVTTLTNSREWVFEGADVRYTFALLTSMKGSETSSICLRGPFNNYDSYQHSLITKDMGTFDVEFLKLATDTVAFPMLPTTKMDESSKVFEKLRQNKRLDSRDRTDFEVALFGELHATKHKPLMEDIASEDTWPVYKGKSFNLWKADTGEYYKHIKSATAKSTLQAVRKNRNSNSAASRMSDDWNNRLETLLCNNFRLVYRTVARSTDSRSMISAIIPPNRVHQHSVTSVLFVRGGSKEMVLLSGILSSFTLDWYVRRFVEANMTMDVVNPLPIPDGMPPWLAKEIISINSKLTCNQEGFSMLASDLGLEQTQMSASQKMGLRHKLEALVAMAYGLNLGEVETILSTFHHDSTVEGIPWRKWYDSIAIEYNKFSTEENQ